MVGRDQGSRSSWLGPVTRRRLLKKTTLGAAGLAAGFNKDKPLKFRMTYSLAAGRAFREAGATLMQDQWKRLSGGSVDVSIAPEEYPVMLKRVVNRDFVYVWFNEAASVVETDAWLQETYRSDGPRNFFGFKDVKVDGMIDKQAVSFKEGERRTLTRELVTYLIDTLPVTIPYGRWFLNVFQPFVKSYSGSWLGESYVDGTMHEEVWLDR